MATLAAYAYFRDSIVPVDQANVSIASSPFLYGLCVYTVLSLRVNNETGNKYLFRPQEHWDRLVQSATIMDFGDFLKNWDYGRFLNTVKGVVGNNNVQEDSLIRVNVFVDEILAGTRMHGLKNSVAIFTYPYQQILNEKGAHLCVSTWQRTSDNAIPARAKVNGSYVNSALMKNEALLNGFDDAISLDEHGHVCESTVANIFLVRHGVLITPDNATSLLEGITRRSVIEVAQHLGIPVEQRRVDRSELYTADEVFLSGTSVRLTPVTGIDHRIIGKGLPGQLTLCLAQALDTKPGGSDKFTDWLVLI